MTCPWTRDNECAQACSCSQPVVETATFSVLTRARDGDALTSRCRDDIVVECQREHHTPLFRTRFRTRYKRQHRSQVSMRARRAASTTVWRITYATAGIPTGSSLCLARGSSLAGGYMSKNDFGAPHGRCGLWMPTAAKKLDDVELLSSFAFFHCRSCSTTVSATTTSGQSVFSSSSQYLVSRRAYGVTL